MPQPVIPTIAADFSSIALLERPNLTSHIAVISGIWNDIEVRIALLLAALIGAEARTVIGIYLSLTSAPAQRAALNAAAALRLDEKQRTELSLLLKRLRKRGIERNSIIHGSWGISSSYSDALIWSDPKDRISHVVDAVDMTKTRRETVETRFDDILRQAKTEQANWLVYKEKDFEEIEIRLREFLVDFNAFSHPFMGPWLQGKL